MNSPIMILSETAHFISIDQQIARWFNGLFNGNGWGNFLLILLSLALTVVLSSLIGLEREIRGRSAGLRTHLLVSVGSAVIMIISIYGFPLLEPGFTRDPARLAAQVVTGVGFLGAGAIIHYAGGIKGLTTASTIWLSMAIGLACGSMNFSLAIISTIIVMIVLVTFRRLERKVTKNHPMIIVLASASRPVLSEILGLAKEFELMVGDINSQMIKDGNEEKIQVIFRLSGEKKALADIDATQFVNELKIRTDAIDIKIINHH